VLAPAGRRFAAAVLLDEDGAAPLWAGPAAPGPIPGAVEWTGRAGALAVVYDDAPVDAPAFAAWLAAGRGPAPSASAMVVELPLRRGAGP
jgi:hypothetical protein